MNLINTMEKEADCLEVRFQDYVQSRGEISLFLFFEGKDDFSYYSPRISIYSGRKRFRKYDCGSKQNVIDLHNMIQNGTLPQKSEVLLFFVDKDFDELSLSTDIFQTPTYAIENFYISDDAICREIKGMIGLSDGVKEDEEDFEKAFNHIISLRNKVIGEIIFANAWYSLQKKKGQRLAENQKPKLSGVKEYKEIKNITEISQLEEKVPNFIKVTLEEVNLEVNRLIGEASSLLRGKYFEQALHKAFDEIFTDSNRKRDWKYFQKKRKVNCNIGVDNFIKVLSPFADTPIELNEYLQKKFFG